MPFRCDAKHFFLTYPQADGIQSKEELMEFLQEKRPSAHYICVAQERHQDGNTHYHAVISHQRRFNCRDDRFFDFKGQHPNIQACKHLGKSINYCQKDGDFVEFGELPESSKSIHDQCYDMERHEWEEYCIKHNIGWNFCESIWRRCHPDNSSFTIVEDTKFGAIGPALSEFTYNNWERALVLIGPTGCGKTSWAIKEAPKPALLVSHLDRLAKSYDPNVHKSIIFDDMVFKHMPVQAQIHLVDFHMPRDIHCRYRVASIPAGVPKIFTCNERPFEQHPAVERRIRVYQINDSPLGF